MPALFLDCNTYIPEPYSNTLKRIAVAYNLDTCWLNAGSIHTTTCKLRVWSLTNSEKNNEEFYKEEHKMKRTFLLFIREGTLPRLAPEWRYSTASATAPRPTNFLGSTATYWKSRKKKTVSNSIFLLLYFEVSVWHAVLSSARICSQPISKLYDKQMKDVDVHSSFQEGHNNIF